MTVEHLAPGAQAGLDRGEAVVCVPVYGGVDVFAQCMRALLAHTPPHAPILVADDASPDPAVRALVDELGQLRSTAHRLLYLRQPGNVGFVCNANTVFAVVHPADVVIVNSDCVVSSGWFEALRSAAYSNTRVATASALTNSGTIVSVPNRNQPAPNLPQDWSLEEAASEVRRHSPRLRPQIPTAVGHCLWIRRSALELVGGFDEAFSPGYEEEVDFSQRCVLHGLSHVVADDALVLHYGGASFGMSGASQALRRDHHAVIQSRYPYYDRWVAEAESDEQGPLTRAIGAAARAFRGLSVTIDGRILTRFLTGSQVHVLELIAALHAEGSIGLRVLTPPDLGEYASMLFARMPSVALLPVAEVRRGVEVSDVVHRPFQVSSPADLDVLRMVGRRLIVTQQDLIAYHNPSYHRSPEAWMAHRRLTRTALSATDQVLFFSRHAAKEALAEDLVDQPRVHVAHLGTDHVLAGLTPDPRPPRGADRIGEKPFLLCLGTDFRHKNRLFALKLLASLHERHGWRGMLVFAGAHVAHGSSAGEEAIFLASHPDLAEDVLDLAAVDEPGKAWLQQHANAIVYPTTFEGFGLVPFEAAEAGLPCLFAPETSLAEMLPSSAALLVSWDPQQSADQVAPVLDPGEARDRHVALLRAAGARLTWRRTAERVLDVYRTAAEGKARQASVLALDQLELESDHARLEDAFRELEEQFGYPGNAVDADLVGPDGVLPNELRRPLLALSRRRWLRVIMLGPMLLTYRLGYMARHRRLPPRRALPERNS